MPPSSEISWGMKRGSWSDGWPKITLSDVGIRTGSFKFIQPNYSTLAMEEGAGKEFLKKSTFLFITVSNEPKSISLASDFRSSQSSRLANQAAHHRNHFHEQFVSDIANPS